jgi:predicted nucleotidyltransferase
VRRLHTPTTDSTAEALFGRSRRAILALLFGQGGDAYYMREIASLTGLAVGSIQRELANLVQAGLVERTVRGKQVYFSANPRSPVYSDLTSLVAKTAGVADVLRTALADLVARQLISMVFIHGSVATGSHTAASDVDLIAIGSATLADVIPVLRGVEDRLGREVNPVIFSADEFRSRVRAGDHFLERVMGRPRIMLIGTEDELAQLAGEPLAG